MGEDTAAGEHQSSELVHIVKPEGLQDIIVPADLVLPLLERASNIQYRMDVDKQGEALTRELKIPSVSDEISLHDLHSQRAAREGTSMEALEKAYELTVRAQDFFEEEIEEIVQYTQRARRAYVTQNMRSIIEKKLLFPMQEAYPDKKFYLFSRNPFFANLNVLAYGVVTKFYFLEPSRLKLNCIATLRLYSSTVEGYRDKKLGNIISVEGLIRDENFFAVNKEALSELKEMTLFINTYAPEIRGYIFNVKQSFHAKRIK